MALFYWLALCKSELLQLRATFEWPLQNECDKYFCSLHKYCLLWFRQLHLCANASGQKPNEFHIFYFIAFDCDIVVRLTCAPLLSAIGQLNVPNIYVLFIYDYDCQIQEVKRTNFNFIACIHFRKYPCHLWYFMFIHRLYTSN